MNEHIDMRVEDYYMKQQGDEMNVTICDKCNAVISPHDPVFETVLGQMLCSDCSVNKPTIHVTDFDKRWYAKGDNGMTFNDKESFETSLHMTRKEAQSRAMEIIKILWAEEDPIEEVEL